MDICPANRRNMENGGGTRSGDAKKGIFDFDFFRAGPMREIILRYCTIHGSD